MTTATRTYKQEDIEQMLGKIRNRAVCTIQFTREFAGGQPATDKGLAAFVQHCLGIGPEDPEFKRTIARIKHEELGETDTTPEEGEVKESGVYAVNCIRRSEHGPFVLEHQIKAMVKQSASRLGLFQRKRGSKGDLAEFGVIEAAGESLQAPDRPWEIYLRQNDAEAPTTWVRLNGRVQTPQGPKSIDHHTEVAAEGSKITFAITWPSNGKVSKDDMALIIGGCTLIGLGSCLSLGYGRFEVESLEIT